jgi:hypothetical protein
MVTQFIEGITNDFDPKVKDFISYARGTLDQSTNGDLLAKSSEPGNTLVKEYAGYSLLGECNGEEEVYLFLTGEKDIILGVNKTTVVEYLVEDLNFKDPIRATFRVKNGCERLIYFVDGLNPDRRINLDRLDELIVDGVFSTERLNLAVTSDSIEIKSVKKTNLDGSLEVGTYSFIVEALNGDLDIIYKTKESLSVPVFNSTKGATNAETTGAYNIASADVNIGGIPKVNGSIEVIVDEFPSTFKYLRLVVLRKTSGDGLQRDAIRVSKLFTNNKLIFKGITNKDGFIDIAEALIPFVIYDTSKQITQIDNRLIRGNLTESVYNWNTFQPFASKIGAKFVVGEQAVDKDPSTYIDGEGFMPDEVIPFGIKYRLKNGKTSPVFPIIGQCLNRDSEGGDINIVTEEQGPSRLELNVNVITRNTSASTYQWTISYFNDGVFTEKSGFRVVPPRSDFQFTLHQDIFTIDTGIFSNVVVEATVTDPLLEVVFANEVVTLLSPVSNSELINQNLPPAPLDGWDDTVYSTWNEDMSWMISEDEYKTLAGDLYGKLDIESLEALKLKIDLPRRYQIYNTAYQINKNEGRLGYYQNEDNVYESPDCSEDFWGKDICGNDVTGSPIRHYRFPDRRLIPEGRIGIQFFNVEYPHEDVISHEFVVAKLDENFILDQGVASRMRGRGDADKREYGFSYLETQGESKDRDTWNAVFTPKTLQKEYQNATFIKNIGLHSGQSWMQAINNDGTGSGSFDSDWNYVSKVTKYSKLEQSAQINVNIITNRFLDRLRYDTVGTDTLINVSVANGINAIETDRVLTMPAGSGLAKISLNTYNKNAYSNPLNLEYERLHNQTIKGSGNFPIFKGNIFNSELQLNNYMLAAREGSWFRSLFGIGQSLFASIASVFADVAKYESFFYKQGFNYYANGAIAGLYQGGGSSEFHSEHLYNLFVDSTYNFKLNHTGESNAFAAMQLEFTPSTMVEDNTFGGIGGEEFILAGNENDIPAYWEGVKAYLNSKLTSYNEENNDFAVSMTPYGEPYNYNKDYNYTDLSASYSLGFNYDFCSNCLNNFPNRYVFSPVSFLEESQDLFRVTLANDFRDMTSNTGEITGLNAKANRLVINTTYSSFVKPVNPQTLQTNESNVFVGTGEFLSLPEIQFRETNTSYGGKQYAYAESSNEFGLQWVDTINGQIFNFNGQGLDVLSDKGWLHWFKTNLPVQGEGSVHLNFDPYFKRLILTKNDVVAINEFVEYPAFPDVTNLKSAYLKVLGVYYYAVGDTIEVVEYGDPKYFEDNSFTICYSFLKQSWDSFQPYVSELGFNNINRMYSFKEGIYLHEIDKNFNTFYGKKYPMIIEVSMPLVQTQFLSSVDYVADFEILDGKRWEPIEDNFNYVWAYNDFQSTGKQSINTINQVTDPFGNINYNNTDISCIKTDNNFKIAQLWDISSNNNIYSNAYVDTANEYPIDKVPTNIEDKGQYQLSKVKGKYVKVRLFFESEQDVKATVHFLAVNNKQSIR